MAKGNYYCEECVEEIAKSDVFWELGRPYCGRCGGELDLDEDVDVVEHISARKLVKPVGTDFDDGSDDEEDDKPGFGEDDEDEDDADATPDEDEEKER